MATQSVEFSSLLTILNTTNTQKNDPKLYDFLRRLLFNTGQLSAAVGSGTGGSSSGGGGTTNNTYNITNNPVVSFFEEFIEEMPGFGPPGSPGGTGGAGSPGVAGIPGPAIYLVDNLEPEPTFPIPGPIGPIGNTGLIGNTGNDGPAIYLTALDGDQGEIGFPGIQGIQGIQGVTGSVGSIGPAIFLTALDGDQGEIGPIGVQGIQGIQGNQGTTGSAGPIGPAVFLLDNQYPDDPMPIPGTQGPIGNTGSAGATGPAGISVAYLDDWSQPDIPIQVAPNISINPFTIPDDSAFSWTNQGGASVTNVTGNLYLYNGIYLLAPATAGTSWRCRQKNLGSFTRLEIAFSPNLLGSGGQSGILLRESGTGKLATMMSASGAAAFGIQHWASATGAATNDSINQVWSPLWSAIWFAVSFSGANILYHISINGIQWIQVLSIAKTTQFTTAPDQWGFAINTSQATYDNAMLLQSFKET